MKNVNLILGTMTFGDTVLAPDIPAFIDTFLDGGYEELDTAYVYNDGDTERLLGEVLPGLKRPFKITTKVNPRVTGRLDGESARMQLNESLLRMKRDSVDAVLLHCPDPATPVESVLTVMQEFYEQGKFKELGLSNYPAWMVADICHICDRRGWVKPTVYQGIYNPLTRHAETELNACLNHFGLRFTAYNPLGGGLLTGKYPSYSEAPTDGRFSHNPFYQRRYWKKSIFAAIDLLRKAADHHGITLVEAAYRWMMHHSMLNADRGDAILIGASKLSHLKQNMTAAGGGPLPEELLAAFEEAWNLAKAECPDYFRLHDGRRTL